MKTNLRETMSAPVLSDAEQGEGAVWVGIVLGTIAAVLYSLKAVFVKLAYLPTEGIEQVPPITLMMLRLGFSFPVYLAILWWVWRRTVIKPTGQQIGLAMLAGVLAYYLCTLLDFTGLQYITAQLERLLLFTYPAFVILFGALFFGGRLTGSGIAAVALAYSGLAVVFLGGDITESSNLWLGSGLVLACAMLFALFQLIAKSFIDRIGSSLFTCLAMLGAATAIFLHFTIAALTTDGIVAAFDLPPRIYALGLTIAVFSTLLPSFFMNIAIGRIGAQKVAMLGMFGPLATIIAAILILDEPFGIWDGVGTLVTIAGIALYMLVSKSKPRQT
ncbi:DMT family transporter [Litorimonas sp. WD9-15]|uniref:DMT family transporter n=1 Tax=Litorimonas sp. WD9-15 TaxID=3418716 RepID=UPI003D000A33